MGNADMTGSRFRPPSSKARSNEILSKRTPRSSRCAETDGPCSPPSTSASPFSTRRSAVRLDGDIRPSRQRMTIIPRWSQREGPHDFACSPRADPEPVTDRRNHPSARSCSALEIRTSRLGADSDLYRAASSCSSTTFRSRPQQRLRQHQLRAMARHDRTPLSSEMIENRNHADLAIHLAFSAAGAWDRSVAGGRIERRHGQLLNPVAPHRFREIPPGKAKNCHQPARRAQIVTRVAQPWA
jgi:hypothetical protein